jgi:hypothetical protein
MENKSDNIDVKLNDVQLTLLMDDDFDDVVLEAPQCQLGEECESCQ